MHRRSFLQSTSLASMGALLPYSASAAKKSRSDKVKNVGVIGLDTSHATAFTKILNDPEAKSDVTGYRVTHALPQGSADIESSVSRIPKYTLEMQEMGVEIVESLDKLLAAVDVVLLETNDGRVHLEQAKAVLEAGKPVFIDKPVAASLADVLTIYELAQQQEVPMFSASSLRFAPTTIAVRNGSIGDVLGADTFSPAKLEPTHPDLFWYGIHGVESLFTVMGPGCKQVRRIFHEGSETVVGEWNDGRIGTFRGTRVGHHTYGGIAHGTEGVAPAGAYEGYRPLVVEIVTFWNTGISPVPNQETLEIYAFMEAAQESTRRDGAVVSLQEVMEKAAQK